MQQPRDTTTAEPAMRLPASRRQLAVVWLRALRVHQYAKNGLVFVPVLTAHRFDLRTFGVGLLAFVALSLAASAVYLLNDLVDIDADRAHPTKRNRPLASGELPVGHARAAIAVLLAAAIAAAFLVGPAFAGVLAIYLVLTTAYTFHLKRRMVLDVVALAALYTLRVIAGAAAIDVVLSEWLLAFSMLMFTSLALIKRYVELNMRADAALPDPGNRDYRVGDAGIVATLAAAAGMNAITIFALYISSPAVAKLYKHPALLWLTCPIMLFWIARALLLANRREMHDDPIVFALRDPASWWVLASMVAVILAAI